MHKHTIDWYIQVNITADAVLAEKRWATAVAYAKTLNRQKVLQLLRLFLFGIGDSQYQQEFTNELIKLDPEFPVSKNTQELRMMAGLVIVTTYEKHSEVTNAFALGIRAADFPSGRIQPVQPAMIGETNDILERQARDLRPDDFRGTDGSPLTRALVAKNKDVAEAEVSGDDDKKTNATKNYRKSVIDAIESSHELLAKRISRLAEESSLLWWLVVGYSDVLQKPISELTSDSYAFAGAAEAADRTNIVPPPPSIRPLFRKVFQGCKPSQKKSTLADYVKAANAKWRSAYLTSVNASDCFAVCPVTAALAKTEELGSPAQAFKVLRKISPGVKADIQLAPEEAAVQLYNEILFLRALRAMEG